MAINSVLNINFYRLELIFRSIPSVFKQTSILVQVFVLMQLFFLVQSSFSLRAQTLSQINQQYTYTLSPEVFFDYRHAIYNDKIVFQSNFAFSLNTQLSSYEITYQWLKSYNSPLKIGEIIPEQYFKRKSDRAYTLDFPVSKESEKNVFAIQFESLETKRRHLFTIDINNKYTIPPAQYLFLDLQGIPLTQKFISKNQKFNISDLAEQDSLRVQYFATDFDGARPPSSTSSNINRFKPDSTFSIKREGTHLLKESGFYLFKNFDKNLTATGFRVEPASYPKLTLIDDLLLPLQYIATPLEYKTIIRSTNPRQAFESFWLNIFPDKEMCKSMIQNYYQTITLANALFTTFRKGWKEDRGMIYIIFGPPDVVNISDAKEVWEYKKTVFSLRNKFVFKKTKNGLCGQQLVLQRNTSYQHAWEKAVKQWRKGKISR